MQIDVEHGDITAARVDAIVNAANERLVPGGGVDGAINAAAGPELALAMRAHGGCPTGDARATPGFRLPARWVIHTVGPVWRGGRAGEADLLASAYRRSLEVAVEIGARSVAFPAISTGVYGFPAEEAATIAVGTVRRFAGPLDRVVLVAFDAAINAAAGPELAQAMRAHGGCHTGDAKPTPAFRLDARWVIHTVGPVWHGGDAGEADLLASAYRRSLEVAVGLGARSVAFPAISTGVYGYPAEEAATIAVEIVRGFDGPIDRVVLVAFDAATAERYRRLLG